MKQLPC